MPDEQLLTSWNNLLSINIVRNQLSQRKLSKGTSQKASALNEVFSSLASATLFVKRKRGDADNFLWLSGLILKYTLSL